MFMHCERRSFLKVLTQEDKASLRQKACQVQVANKVLIRSVSSYFKFDFTLFLLPPRRQHLHNLIC